MTILKLRPSTPVEFLNKRHSQHSSSPPTLQQGLRYGVVPVCFLEAGKNPELSCDRHVGVALKMVCPSRLAGRFPAVSIASRSSMTVSLLIYQRDLASSLSAMSSIMIPTSAVCRPNGDTND